MKNLVAFILISANNGLLACGYYPYGEDTRISLFNPEVFDYYSYANFNYSSNIFYDGTTQYPANYIEPNIQLWFDYCKGNVSTAAIDEAIYKQELVCESSSNKMIQYLYQQKDSDALNYIRFAQNCEYFNSWQEDPWERKDYFALPKRTKLMNNAIALSINVQNRILKKRYTFLAIRLAYYNREFDTIKTLFTSVFENTTDKNILYYWSLYFRMTAENDSSLKNFYASQVFANAIDKRFPAMQRYNAEVAVGRVLQHAKTNEERLNVYLLAGIKKPDKALSYLQQMYALNPRAEGLSFLLLREINKMEDWIFTPYYTLFEPSISGQSDTSVRLTLSRAETDRLYAKEVLQFVSKVDVQKTENPLFWRCCKVQLLFMVRDYSSCLKLVAQLKKTPSLKNDIFNQLEMIEALALTANQDKRQAIVLENVKSIILKNKNNAKFVFAIGKELEYLGNTTDATALYSVLGQTWEDGSFVFWKTLKNRGSSYSDYFSDYFNYADYVYTPQQTQDLINDIQKNEGKTDSFSVFKYAVLKNETQRLYDLLGTKYIRQNKLENALSAFSRVENQYWNDVYSVWERPANSVSFFDKNPFYCLKYTPAFIEPKDTIRLNKFTITQQIVNYLHKVENKREKDLDYYYFLIANGYYNMGCEGNSWMMRRYYVSSYTVTPIEDDAEFFQSDLAKKYYLLAKQHAKTEKFKALCLRMVVRCEHHKIDYLYRDYWGGADYNSVMEKNRYYLDLKNNYPDYFDDLISDCERFEMYFEARR